MAKMNVTEKDFDAFLQATESLMAMSGGFRASHIRKWYADKFLQLKFAFEE